MSDLLGVLAKIQRAYVHLKTFGDEADPYLKSCQTSVVVEVHDERPEAAILYTVSPAPPLNLSIIIGDCIHNARSALDNLACALVRLKKRGSKCSGTAFPVCIDDLKYPEMRRCLDGMPEKAKTLIDGLQPYAQTSIYGPPKNHPLAVLNRLSNRDKHRAPNLTVSRSVNTKITFEGVGKTHVLTINRALHSGTPAFFKDVPRDIRPGAKVQVNGATGIGFQDIDAWADGRVDAIMGVILQFIEQDVIPRFEPLFNQPADKI